MINHKPEPMRVTFWVEVVVFLSAYYPLFLILLIRDVKEGGGGIPVGLSQWGLSVTGWGVSLFLLSSVSCLALAPIMRRLLTKQEGGTAIKVQEAEPISGDMLNYTLPFLIGLFAFSYSDWQSIVSLLVFLAFMLAFLHKEQITLLNPMLLLMNVRLYKIKYKEIGRERISSVFALCLGAVEASNVTVSIKETAGIMFIYPYGDGANE
ncbi:hypothetical protein [Stutzerimonas balearica]|uniref:hypothetical protein n=1 Tax=Stutzerimonas balearica TaxID=74829 RepID=UPI00385180F6